LPDSVNQYAKHAGEDFACHVGKPACAVSARFEWRARTLHVDLLAQQHHRVTRPVVHGKYRMRFPNEDGAQTKSLTILGLLSFPDRLKRSTAHTLPLLRIFVSTLIVSMVQLYSQISCPPSLFDP
jgi:hypothetical protein